MHVPCPPASCHLQPGEADQAKLGRAVFPSWCFDYSQERSHHGTLTNIPARASPLSFQMRGHGPRRQFTYCSVCTQGRLCSHRVSAGQCLRGNESAGLLFPHPTGSLDLITPLPALPPPAEPPLTFRLEDHTAATDLPVTLPLHPYHCTSQPCIPGTNTTWTWCLIFLM